MGGKCIINLSCIFIIQGDNMKLTWDITNKCNLRCKHCAAISLLEENTSEYKNWKQVIDYVSDFVDTITLLGGEPLLHPEIEELIKYADSRGKKILLITNGQADTKILDAIMKYNIVSILVSIEGLEETHDKIRGKGTWKKAMNCLNYLINLNKNKPIKTQIGVNIVANKLNRDEITKFIEATRELNIMYQITSLVLKGNAETNKDTLEISSNEILNVFEEIAEYHAQNPNVEINFLNDYPIFKSYLNKKFGTRYEIKGFTCEALIGSIYADPYGNIYTCQNHKNIKISLDTANNWNEDFSVFKPFLKLLHMKNKNNTCDVCDYKDICIPCPYNPSSEIPKFCDEVIKRLNSLPLPLYSKFRLNKPYAIIESENRYDIFYPNLGKSTEYTIEGIKILKAIKDFKTLKDISEEVSFSPEIVYEFLLQEKNSSKVTELREQLTS